MLRTVTAYAPGHLTGLFQICDQPVDPILKGSRGSGVSIDQGVYTKVTVEPADTLNWVIAINGKETRKAIVSENVLSKLKLRINKPVFIQVKHTLEIPQGSGFGGSGAGALTLALAANKVLNCGFSELEAQRIAHVADIECKTGLGSVVAAMRGGFGVMYKPGGPGVCEAYLYGKSADYRVVYLHFAPIQTKEVLNNPRLRAKINELGGRYVDELKQELTPIRFMERSKKFTDHVGLSTPRLKKIFQAGEKKGILFTMAMFGEVAFTLIEKERANEASETLERTIPGCEPVIVGIENQGARFV